MAKYLAAMAKANRIGYMCINPSACDSILNLSMAMSRLADITMCEEI
jgi:enhancing lycopene biosynthesis protein 2